MSTKHDLAYLALWVKFDVSFLFVNIDILYFVMSDLLWTWELTKSGMNTMENIMVSTNNYEYKYFSIGDKRLNNW